MYCQGSTPAYKFGQQGKNNSYNLFDLQTFLRITKQSQTMQKVSLILLFF